MTPCQYLLINLLTSCVVIDVVMKVVCFFNQIYGFDITSRIVSGERRHIFDLAFSTNQTIRMRMLSRGRKQRVALCVCVSCIISSSRATGAFVRIYEISMLHNPYYFVRPENKVCPVKRRRRSRNRRLVLSGWFLFRAVFWLQGTFGTSIRRFRT
jgi:hypothetical protein